MTTTKEKESVKSFCAASCSQVNVATRCMMYVYPHVHLKGESRGTTASLIWINHQVHEGLSKIINSEQVREAASGVKWPTAIWEPGHLWNRCVFIHWFLQVWIKLTAGKHNLAGWKCRRNSEGRNSLSLTGMWPCALEVTPPTLPWLSQEDE